MEEIGQGKQGNPFWRTFPDPVCKLNLQETSEFVKSFPTAQRSTGTMKSVDAPSTPGRPVFSFSVGNFSRKFVPSKWDDAEKWVVNGSSCHYSPSHNHVFKPPECLRPSKYCNGVTPTEEVLAENSRVEEDEKKSMASNGVSAKPDVLLKDKLTKEGNMSEKPTPEVVHEVKLRDIGTSMTPIESSTPIMNSSPARHNTPADRSGPLAPLSSSSSASTIDIMQLQESHLAKLQLGTMHQDSVTSNWSSREEEEEDVSKSLRHFEASNEYEGGLSRPRAHLWEEEAANCCLRYKREEAQIQAWVNLQSAKAEAQSKKLEVKIQNMISKNEEKLMKRMAMVHRKAEELRAAAKLQHSGQKQKVSERVKKMVKRQIIDVSSRPTCCSCFPCNTHHL